MPALTDQDHLAAAGRLLHGVDWQSPLARDLKVAVRTLQRWAGRPTVLAPWVWTEIAKLLDRRATELEPKPAECRELAEQLRERAKG